MMKILMNHLTEEIDDKMSEDILGLVKNEMPCIMDGCDGKVSYFLKQMDDGSVATCNKCHKSIMIQSAKI